MIAMSYILVDIAIALLPVFICVVAFLLIFAVCFSVHVPKE